MNSKLWIILIVIIGMLFSLVPANAETGTLSLVENTFKTYTISTTAGATTPDFTRLNVDVGDYNFIDLVFVNTTQTSAPVGSPIAYATNGRSTSFTITSCGSGGGTATYSKASTAIAWYFTNPSTVTCSPLVLSYTTNIFSDLTLTGGFANFDQTTVGNLNINQPVIVNGTSGGWIGGCQAPCDASHSYFVTYQTIVHTVTNNNYTITYQSGGGNQLFTTNITKGTINTKVLIQNATGTPLTYPIQGDNSFNTNTFEVINTYGQGIALNMSRNNGAFELVVVNSTGSSIVVPTPTPTPPPVLSNSTTGVAISWDKSVYNINEVGTLTGNVTVSPPFLGDFRITITNSLGQQAFYIWDSSGSFPQVQQFLFSFPSADTYTANFISHSPFTGDSTLVSLSVQAVSPVSYIFAPSNAVTGSNITISYKFNPAPTTGAIEDVPKDLNGNDLPGIYFNTSLCSCDTSLHSLNYTINGAGKHTFRLWDTTKIKVVASTIVDVTDTGSSPPQNITVNFLALDNTQYAVNDVINGQYQISTANWSTFGYFQASLISSGGIGMGAVTLNQQSGTFQIPVTGGAFGVFQSGLASVNITAGNSVLSATNKMISAPVTILSTNGAYSVSANPNTICKSQIETVKYTGASGLGILQEIYMTPAGTTKINNYSFTQNGTRQFIYNDGTVKDNGGIIYSVLNTNGDFQMNTISKYKASGCTAPGITPPAGPTPTPTGTQQASEIVALITSNIFWALTITVGLMIAIAWKTKDGFPTGTIGVLVSGIFTFIGWLPAWIFFTMFVIGALFIAASIVEKQMRNVTQ